MSIETASYTISQLTGMKLHQSSFAFYSDGLDIYDTPFSEEVGFFIPRELKGYIKLDTLSTENARRTAHEVSHGFYLENTPAGKRIIAYDRQIAEAEKQLFGRLLKRDERVLILTDRGITGIYSMDEMHNEIRELIPKDIDLQRYEAVAFLKEKNFADYRGLRATYAGIISDDIENHEGFCTLIEHKVLKQIDPVFAGQLLRLSFDGDNVYGRGLRKLRALEAAHGLSAVVDYLMKRR